MLIVYNLLIYILFLLLLPVWILILLAKKKFRAGFKQKSGFFTDDLKQTFKSMQYKPVWFHAVSVGECLAVADLVNEFHHRHTDVPIVVSTVTYTGQQIAQKRLGDIATIIYFPYDLSFITRKVLNIIDPQMVVIVETEIWPGFIYNAYKKNVPVILINGRLSPKSSKNYVKFRFFFKKVLGLFTRFLMQSKLDAERILAMGADSNKVEVVGNLKYDIKPNFSENEIKQLRQKMLLSDHDKVIIAGSTHDTEEEIILEQYIKLKESNENLKLILVPRHPERYGDVIALLESKKILFGRRSCKDTFADAPVFLLDTMGELLSFYSISDIAFVGGSLYKKGGHNPLEPAVYSVPVLVGPHTFNFLDITQFMVEAGAAIQVNDKNALYPQFEKLLTDKNYYNTAKKACFKVFETNRGATDKTLEVIKDTLNL